MSVLSCVRNGCSNIMCDTYIPGTGYICNDCKKQFRDYAAQAISGSVPDDDDIEYALADFMEIHTDDYRNQASVQEVVDEFFKRHTKE